MVSPIGVVGRTAYKSGVEAAATRDFVEEGKVTEGNDDVGRDEEAVDVDSEMTSHKWFAFKGIEVFVNFVR
jgi:hypothetical protein